MRNFRTADDLIAEVENDPEMRKELDEGREWLRQWKQDNPPRDYSDAAEDFWRAAEAITEGIMAACRRRLLTICLTVLAGLVVVGVTVWAVLG